MTRQSLKKETERINKELEHLEECVKTLAIVLDDVIDTIKKLKEKV